MTLIGSYATIGVYHRLFKTNLGMYEFEWQTASGAERLLEEVNSSERGFIFRLSDSYLG